MPVRSHAAPHRSKVPDQDKFRGTATFFRSGNAPRHACPSVGGGLIFEDRPSMAPADTTLRVLIVDDEPLIRWSVSETLGQAGHTVTEAADGAGARQSLAHRPAPDVVLLDFCLPDSHDLRLLADVRQLAPAAGVVMMTAFAESDLAAAALTLGARGVVAKPVDMRDLDRIVREAVESH